MCQTRGAMLHSMVNVSRLSQGEKSVPTGICRMPSSTAFQSTASPDETVTMIMVVLLFLVCNSMVRESEQIEKLNAKP